MTKNAETLKQYVRRVIRECGGSFYSVSRAVGFNPNYLDNKHEMSRPAFTKFASYLGIPAETQLTIFNQHTRASAGKMTWHPASAKNKAVSKNDIKRLDDKLAHVQKLTNAQYRHLVAVITKLGNKHVDYTKLSTWIADQVENDIKKNDAMVKQNIVNKKKPSQSHSHKYISADVKHTNAVHITQSKSKHPYTPMETIDSCIMSCNKRADLLTKIATDMYTKPLCSSRLGKYIYPIAMFLSKKYNMNLDHMMREEYHMEFGYLVRQNKANIFSSQTPLLNVYSTREIDAPTVSQLCQFISKGCIDLDTFRYPHLQHALNKLSDIMFSDMFD